VRRRLGVSLEYVVDRPDSKLALGGTTCAAALLNDVRELMCQEVPTARGVGSIRARSEYDVGTYRVRRGADGMSRRTGRGICMHAHPAEVMSESLPHLVASRWLEELGSGSQGANDDWWRHLAGSEMVVRCGWGAVNPFVVTKLAVATPRRARVIAASLDRRSSEPIRRLRTHDRLTRCTTWERQRRCHGVMLVFGTVLACRMIGSSTKMSHPSYGPLPAAQEVVWVGHRSKAIMLHAT
jgi:hypothetical protein